MHIAVAGRSESKTHKTMSYGDFEFAPKHLSKDVKDMYANSVLQKSDFNKWLEKLKEDDCGRIQTEFEELSKELKKQNISAKSWKCNAAYNRYNDMPCYDDSRLILDDGLSPDYIHANWLEGYQRHNAYILAQGPMDNTIFDFWRMIWQERVATIVMVTRLDEKGRPKCSRYFPKNGTELFHSGFFVIDLKALEKRNLCIASLLSVTNTLTDVTRHVVHVWYTMWPDQGVPDDVESLRMFLNYVKVVNLNVARKFYNFPGQHKRGPPIVYHCSAGIGRSAALVALDYITEAMTHGSHTDLYQLIRNMRKERYHVIHTKIQLLFLYNYVVTMASLNRYQFLQRQR